MPSVFSLSHRPFRAPRELQDAIAEIGKGKSVKTDAVLFKQGEPAKGLFLVESGKIVLSQGSGRRKKLFGIADAGSILGLPAVVRNQPYSLTATAVAESKLTFVSRTKAQRLLQSDPQLCFKAVQVLSNEVRALRLQT